MSSALFIVRNILTLRRIDLMQEGRSREGGAVLNVDTVMRRRWLSVRFYAVGAVLMLCFAALAVRLFVLCIIEHDKYQGLADENILSATTLKADRGAIYDRNMNILADTATRWRIYLSPCDVESAEQAEGIAHGLCRVLGDCVSYESIYKSVTSVTARDRTVLSSATSEQKDAAVRLALTYGYTDVIHTEATAVRTYPYGELAAHVLGFVGTDSGLLGLEAYYEEYLKGEDGRYLTSKDAQGGRLPSSSDSFIEAVDGASLHTTLDAELQRLLENQLKNAYLDAEAADRVTGIAMDPSSGEILAMATYPSFDLNSPFTLDEYSKADLDALGAEEGSDEYKAAYRTALYKMWNNKAVSVLYEPGSTFKVITTATALECGVTSLSDRFYCSGAMRVQGYGQAIRCHKRIGHGSLTFAEALQLSCNPSMMTLAARIGGTRFMDYFIAFGYTSRTGIDLPGEALGIYHSREDFNTVELAVYSFGQTFKVTPIRQLTSICAVANGGTSVTPHLVSSIVDCNGETVWSFEEKDGERVVSAEVCNTLSAILEEGVSGDGGAKNAAVAGYKIAAKTGTSQKRDIKDENLYVGSCVAYAPADDPKIAVIIVVDEPQSSIYYGSTVAAPYVSAFLAQALPYLGIEPEYSEKELAALSVEIGDYVGGELDDAKKAISGLGLGYEVIGGGSNVIAQVPSAHESVMRNTGRVLLFTGGEAEENVRVPNVVGKLATDAINSLISAGFNIQLAGVSDYSRGIGATVIAQSVDCGELPRGTVITLTLRYLDGTE